MIKIWHNNQCSKSREAKQILDDSDVDFEVFEYLKSDFSGDDIREVMTQLNISDVRDMLRDGEELYKELEIQNLKSQDAVIDLVVKNPKLVQRPIIIKDKKAVIARPMQNLTDLLT